MISHRGAGKEYLKLSALVNNRIRTMIQALPGDLDHLHAKDVLRVSKVGMNDAGSH